MSQAIRVDESRLPWHTSLETTGLGKEIRACDFSPDTGTLLINITHEKRRLVRLTVDQQLGQVLIESDQPDRRIALKDIVASDYGSHTSISALKSFGLHHSVQRYWFTFTHTHATQLEESLHFLAFDASVAKRWSEATISASSLTLLGYIQRLISKICRPTISNDNMSLQSHNVNTSKVESRVIHTREQATLHYWEDWPFMLNLTLDHWTAEHILELWFRVEVVLRIERDMKNLEHIELRLWDEYVRRSPGRCNTPKAPLDHDELLAATVGKVSSDPDEAGTRQQSILVLRSLELLRHRKAQALDHFDIDEVASGLFSGVELDAENNIGAHFWAILVGINVYEDVEVPELSGCVADVKRIADYLSTVLHVPESHILVLTSPSDDKIKGIDGGPPERANIIRAFYTHFRDNTDVQRGDNLLFHFSGHGSSYGPVAGLSDSITEALCPMDRGGTSDTLAIYDISDRELNIIFADVCESKGPRLTVILDCCHYGGAIRTLSLCGRLLDGARVIDPHRDEKAVQRMFESAESRKRLKDTASPLSESWTNDMTSHVLLVACQPHELAKETEAPGGGRLGAFTFALVSALSSPQGIDPALTYVDLVQKVIQPPPMQTVVLAGARMNSRLWFQEDLVSAPAMAIRDSYWTP